MTHEECGNIKVLALSDHLGYPDGRLHGATTYYATTFPRLSRAGVDLTVCFIRAPHPAFDKLTSQGVKPIFLNKKKYDPCVIGFLQRIIRNNGVQILHLSGLKSHLIGRYLGAKLGCKTIIHLHDTTPLSPVMKALQRLFARSTDMALAVSKVAANFGAEQYRIPPHRIRVLHYGIDVHRFRCFSMGYRASLCRELNIPDDSKLIGMLGRLDAMKGHEYAIQSMPLVLRHCPKAVLIIFGQGARREELERMIRGLALGRHIILAGQRENIPDILGALDLVAMPSVFGEGLPFACIEAIAAGKPVVAFPTAGIPEVVVNDLSGILVPTSDISALGEAMAKLLVNDSMRKRLGRGALEHSERFTIQRHVQELIGIYLPLVTSSH